MLTFTRFRQPLHLSAFSLDEFENSLRHSVVDPPCPLLAEIHSTLIYNLRTVSFVRHGALLSLLKRKEEIEYNGVPGESVLGITTDQLVAAMADVGNNWERVPLRFSEGREGWEDALVGCLKDVCSTRMFLKTSLTQHIARELDQLSTAAGNSYKIAVFSC